MDSSFIVELINLPKGDILLEQENYNSRLETAVNLLSDWLVPGLFAIGILGILCRHDAEAMWAAMGSVVNIMLYVIIKQILKKRPAVSLPSGVPSLHAQSIFCIVLFAIFSIVQSLGMNVITLTISGFALAISSFLSWIRVSQRLHTLSQVVVGATIGTIFSILCYWSWNVGVHNHMYFSFLGSNSYFGRFAKHFLCM